MRRLCCLLGYIQGSTSQSPLGQQPRATHVDSSSQEQRLRPLPRAESMRLYITVVCHNAYAMQRAAEEVPTGLRALLTVERHSMAVVMDRSIGAAKRRFERFIV
jgi:hypothetical protein